MPHQRRTRVVALAEANDSWETAQAAAAGAEHRRDYDAAESKLLDALRLVDDPDASDLRLGTSLLKLANFYLRRQNVPRQQQVGERLLSVREKELGDDDPDLAPILHRLGDTYRQLGHGSEAEALHARALAIRERALGPDHPELVSSLHSMALHYFWERQYADAEILWNRAWAILEQHGADGLITAVLDCLAMSYAAHDDHTDAECVLRRRLEISDRDHEDDLRVGSVFETLAAAYYDQERYPDSRRAYDEALARYSKWFGAATNERRLRGPANARTRARFRASLAEAKGRILHRQADILRAGGRPTDAREVDLNAEGALRRALAFREQDGKPDDLTVVSELQVLADVQLALGKFAEAEPLYRRVVGIHEAFASQQLDTLHGPDFELARARVKAATDSHTVAARRGLATVSRARE